MPEEGGRLNILGGGEERLMLFFPLYVFVLYCPPCFVVCCDGGLRVRLGVVLVVTDAAGECRQVSASLWKLEFQVRKLLQFFFLPPETVVLALYKL